MSYAGSFSSSFSSLMVGPTDLLCIFKLPNEEYRVVFLEEIPAPGSDESEATCLRLKCKLSSEGFPTFLDAQRNLVLIRTKFKISDRNVISEYAFEIDSLSDFVRARNWLKKKNKVTLAEAVGLPRTK